MTRFFPENLAGFLA